MVGEVTMLRPAASNPATKPVLTDTLVTSVEAKTTEVLTTLKNVVNAFGSIAFANSFGAEDMVLTDIILKNQLKIEIFSLDTGRLHYSSISMVASFHHTPRTIRRALEFIESGVIRAATSSITLPAEGVGVSLCR